MKSLSPLILASVFSFAAGVSAENPSPNRYIVVDPVADVRRDAVSLDPHAGGARPYATDDFEETQLLFGEEVHVLEERGEWVRVEAVEQPEFSHNQKWEGYPGWVLKKALAPFPSDWRSNAAVAVRYGNVYDDPESKAPVSEFPLGSRLVVLEEEGAFARFRRPENSDGWISVKDIRYDLDLPRDEESRRKVILKTAKFFLGDPYYWGGRAGHRPEDQDVPSGLDCSGLVNVCYRAAGVVVPRDSFEQYKKASLLASPSEMRPGDLAFLAKPEEPGKITHVMIYAGGENFIEAVQEFNEVRRVTIMKKMGVPFSKIVPGKQNGSRFVYFGRLL